LRSKFTLANNFKYRENPYNIMTRSVNLSAFFFVVSLVLLATSAFAVTQEWVVRYNGPAAIDESAAAIAVDESGNVYVTGTSYGGPGTAFDYATVKYNAGGVEQWVARYDGTAHNQDNAKAIAVDSSGNVYVTGESSVPPGTGSVYLDYVTVKYNADGNQAWVARYNGPGNSQDNANAITVDSSGNVYVAGRSVGLTTDGYATIKYDTDGNELWVARYEGPNGATATAVVVDSLGNVYVTGNVVTGGCGSACQDYAAVKYNSSGDQQWASLYDGPADEGDSADSIAVDESGNVYVAGTSSGGPGTLNDYATVKYNAGGAEQWVSRYDGPANSWETANSIALDSSGNVYVGGYSYGGPGTSYDYATIKYNTDGVEQWVSRYDNSSGSEMAALLAVDSSGNAYVTGYSVGSGTGKDYATVKYDTNGSQLWVQRYNGPANSDDEAAGIAIDGSGGIYVTGNSPGTRPGPKGAFYADLTTIKYFDDTTPPSVSEVALKIATKKAKKQFNVTATDNAGVIGCDFYWNGSNVSSMALASGNATDGVWAANYTPTDAGDVSAWANCSDAAGNTAKNETAVTVQTFKYNFSDDFDGSTNESEYTEDWGGIEASGYDWGSAVKIYVPPFTTGWILINMSAPANSAVFKFNGTDTFLLNEGAYGEPGKYNITDGIIYINVTPGDPGFGGVPPLPVGAGGATYAAPEADLFLVVALFCLSVLLLGARGIRPKNI
jgi:uncharacterized delta-60 repeat protein